MKIRALLLTISFFSFVAEIFTQEMPNFSVIDAHGNEHKLYEDYLDQGKTVLIDVFFTTCPLCNNIAPLLEELYQEWGAGDHDVEFLALSNKSWDDNDRVLNFDAKHGLTYPSAGAEGGSVEAVQTINGAGFGTIFGTPFFIVVAPDRSVQWDVRGANDQATIVALGEAFEETGAQKPTVSSLLQPLNKTHIRIAPNPASSFFTINLHSNKPSHHKIIAYNMIGKKIKVLYDDVAQSVHLRQELLQWKPGFYFIRFMENGRVTKTSKLIVE